jgi:hypothetical protein
VIPDQLARQIAEIEALLARSRATTAAVAAQREARTAQEPYSVTRIAPRRVDPAPLPTPQRDRLMDAIVVRLRTRG